MGKKFLVGAAGLLLCGFLVTHLAGNLILFAGEGSFNQYAAALESNPLIEPAEVVLFALFAVHIALSLWLRWQNRQARPVRYAEERAKGGRTPGSRTVTWTALLVLAFLVVHIKTFKFGDQANGLYRLVVGSFRNPFYSGFYVLAMGGLALHLSHGVQSACQTFGLNHPRYTPAIKAFGWLFAAAIAGGFAVIPVWAFLRP